MSFVLDGLYLALLVLLSPWLLVRSYRTGRYRSGLRAKLLGQVPPVPASSAPRIWFHGVSVGEIHLLTTLIGAFQKRHPDWSVIVSSTTDTGLAEARTRFPGLHVIAWPFDFSWAVRNALDMLRPDAIVLAESELWPNFLAEAQSRQIPVIVVNARLSPRSFSRYRKVAQLARRLFFNKLTRIGVQSQDYLDRYRALGLAERQLMLTGSVKYDGAVGDRNTPKGQALAGYLAEIRGTRNPATIWVAGSTHAPEEAIVLDAFETLSQRHPELFLILVPRHPDRFEEVAALLESRRIPFARRSRGTTSQPVHVLLLDTVGELGAAWGRADLGYVGGTLDGRRGGQSMIEPAGYGVPTVFGPHVWNFRDAASRLVEAGGAIPVRSAAELPNALLRLLEEPDLRDRMGSRARQLVREQQGATARTLDLIDSVLAQPIRSEKAA